MFFGKIIGKILTAACAVYGTYLVGKLGVSAVKAIKPTKEDVKKKEAPVERQVTVCDDETGDMRVETEYEITVLSFKDKAKVYGRNFVNEFCTLSPAEEKFMDASFWVMGGLWVISAGYLMGIVDYDEELEDRLNGHWKSWTGENPDEDTPLYQKYAAAAANMAKNDGVTSFGFYKKNGDLLGYARKDMINDFLDAAKETVVADINQVHK